MGACPPIRGPVGHYSVITKASSIYVTCFVCWCVCVGVYVGVCGFWQTGDGISGGGSGGSGSYSGSGGGSGGGSSGGSGGSGGGSSNFHMT